LRKLLELLERRDLHALCCSRRHGRISAQSRRRFREGGCALRSLHFRGR
jgi:hypothetical protein